MPENTILLWKDVHEIADKVCTHFGLSYGKIVPETKKLAKYYGVCWPCPVCLNRHPKGWDGESCRHKILYLRLHQLNKPRVPLARKTILQTLAHELAHLWEWKHGPLHEECEFEILEYMRELGYEV